METLTFTAKLRPVSGQCDPCTTALTFLTNEKTLHMKDTFPTEMSLIKGKRSSDICENAQIALF